MKKIKIAIVDDHLIVAKGLRQLIEEEENMEVIFTASNADSLFEKLEIEDIPDIITMDLSMPGMSGMEATQILKKRYSSIKVIIISMYPNDQYEIRAMRLGAWAYLGKELVHETLIGAINIVYSVNEPSFSLLAESILKKDYLPKDPTM